MYLCWVYQHVPERTYPAIPDHNLDLKTDVYDSKLDIIMLFDNSFFTN